MTFRAFTMDEKKKRWDWNNAENAGFWNDGGDCVTGSNCSIAAFVHFYPKTLKETPERLFKEKFWRKEHSWVLLA